MTDAPQRRWTVTCSTTACPNRGSFRMIGAGGYDGYVCSECHKPMTVAEGWPDPDCIICQGEGWVAGADEGTAVRCQCGTVF